MCYQRLTGLLYLCKNPKMIQTIATIILPVFIIIAIGYFANVTKIISNTGNSALTKFSQRIALPIMLFLNVSDLDLEKVLNTDLLLSFYLSAMFCFVLGTLGGLYFFSKSLSDSISIGFCCLFSNSLLLGLPITELAFGTEALRFNFIIISFHAPFCYLIGILAMEISLSEASNKLKIIKKTFFTMFSNPLALGIVLGFFSNTTGLKIPMYFEDALQLISVAGIPVALFALGGVLTQFNLLGNIPEAFMISIISLILHPILVITLGNHIFVLSQQELKSALITAAMAPGINAFIFATMYKKSTALIANTIIFSTAISVITAAFWISHIK